MQGEDGVRLEGTGVEGELVVTGTPVTWWALGIEFVSSN